jgi:hypothetical protein
MTEPAFMVSSDSSRGPGREHLVWHHYRAADGTSRSRIAAVTGDRDHADRIAEALNHPVPGRNPAAVLAAVSARGPRCERCGKWTCRPSYLNLPWYIARLCADCLPLRPELQGMELLALTQVFRSDLPRYADRDHIEL